MAKKILFLIVAASLVAACSKQDCASSGTGNWAPDVYQAIRDFISACNAQPGKEYVVFDFDNTSSIFDISEQLLPYQLETMSFEMTPDEFRQAIFHHLDEASKEVTDRLEAIASDYGTLYSGYGPFSYAGLSAEQQETISADTLWLDFAIGVATLYKDLPSLANLDLAYIWLYQLYAGMTPEQLYSLASRSHRHFSQMPTTERSWTLGDVSWSHIDGISVTDDVRNLWKWLHDNDIDVWVCSASCLQTVMAAVDVFGLHDYCSGVVAYVYQKDEDGRLLPDYDYRNGCGAIPLAGGSWKSDNLVIGCPPYAKDKVNAVNAAIAPKYSGQGPSAGFGDSSGDFNFCTEFSSLKMVIYFNRADRKITEGGGLIAELATYQKEVLGYDLASANAAGDTFYLLQGRDENGLRSLRKSNRTVRFGGSEEKLFCNSDNYTQYGYFKEQSLSTEQILNTFAISTPADESPFGIAYGFLEEYDGYHHQ